MRIIDIVSFPKSYLMKAAPPRMKTNQLDNNLIHEMHSQDLVMVTGEFNWKIWRKYMKVVKQQR